jgi:hypothetical protein
MVILASQPFSFSMESNAVSRERYGVVLGTCQVVLAFVPDDGRTYLAWYQHLGQTCSAMVFEKLQAPNGQSLGGRVDSMSFLT